MNAVIQYMVVFCVAFGIIFALMWMLSTRKDK